ncbi:MAG: DNA alkylation repair protein [Aestuariivita sp.]|nr:DNA alkylation repair protein [Aestuariivita sp.]
MPIIPDHSLMTPYINALKADADPERAPQMAQYHKVTRPYLGLMNKQIDDMVKIWRRELSVDNRVTLADQLWNTNIYEGRLAAAKLLTQNRMDPDYQAWSLMYSWAQDFDSWAIADHVCMAGHKRLLADPTRLDDVEQWTHSDHMWSRRAALVISLPWTKQQNPTATDMARRERILKWAESYAEDQEWFIQKAIAWWLRELSKRDATRVSVFLENVGHKLKPFAQREAAKYLNK